MVVPEHREVDVVGAALVPAGSSVFMLRLGEGNGTSQFLCFSGGCLSVNALSMEQSSR